MEQVEEFSAPPEVEDVNILPPFEGCLSGLEALIKNWLNADETKRRDVLNSNTADINDDKFNTVKLLHIFCAYGLKESVRLALEKGANPKAVMMNPVTKFPYTPLMLAVMFGHTEIVKMLLVKGAPYEDKALTGNPLTIPSLLEIAAKNNNTDLVDYLLSVPGVNPEFTYVPPTSALSAAINNNNYPMCKSLILAGLIPDALTVHQIAEERQVKISHSITRLLKILSPQYDNGINSLQKNLIHYVFNARAKLDDKKSAEYRSATELFSILIDNIDNLDQQRKAILQFFRALPKLNVFAMNLIASCYNDRTASRELGLRETELEVVDLTQKREQLKLLNRLKAEKLQPIERNNQLVNNPEWNKKVLQILEPFQGIEIPVEMLQNWVTLPDIVLSRLKTEDRDAVISIAETIRDRGVTILHVMCAYGHTACVDMLLKVGADPNQLMETKKRPETKNITFWYSPLTLAAKFGHLDIVKLLVAQKAAYKIDKLADDPNAQTPLEIAAQNDDLDMVRYLLSVPKLDADPENDNAFIRYHNTSPTALHWAVINRNATMCWELLCAGANPDLITEYQQTKDKPSRTTHELCKDTERSFSIPLWMFSTQRAEPPVQYIKPEFRLVKHALLALHSCENKLEKAKATTVFKQLLNPVDIVKQNQVLISYFNSIPKKFSSYPLTQFEKALMKRIVDDADLCAHLAIITTKTLGVSQVPLDLTKKEDAELLLNRLAGRDLASSIQRQRAMIPDTTDSESEEHDGYTY